MITQIAVQSVINVTYCLRLNRITNENKEIITCKIIIMFRNCPLQWVLLFCCILRGVTPQCSIAQVCVTDLSDSDCKTVWTPNEVAVPGSSISGCCPNCGIPPRKFSKTAIYLSSKQGTYTYNTIMYK